MPSPPDDPRPEDHHLRCTWCGSSLTVKIATDATYEPYVRAIECDDYDCRAEWDEDGTVQVRPEVRSWQDEPRCCDHNYLAHGRDGCRVCSCTTPADPPGAPDA